MPRNRFRPLPARRHARGFTLLEMIVVLVIIGLIMGLVGPRLFSQADKAKVQSADTQVRMLKGALETMRLDVGRFPTEQEGLEMLVTRPGDKQLARPLRHSWEADGRSSVTHRLGSTSRRARQ